ncbi:MAG TPA: phospholipid carrier-dependent glycosyltransferase, partial [Candidatus Binataceae bacterium]|nr:phospholipid carrier-dependent glycosyltransferase [Candidatus Binataceae bacterium]
PLIYWTTAAAIRLLGRNEFAARFQAALASAGEVAVVETLGEAMFGALAGMLGALALALSPIVFGFARFATPDPALAFFMTAALASFYAAANTPTFRTGRGRLWMVMAAAMLALGTLAKGPVALLLGGAIAVLWLIMEGRWRDALRMPWLECAAVYAAIAIPWFVLAARRNPGFAQFFFVHEHLHRYLEDTEHGWGPWFFVPIVIGGAWPWLYFVAFGLGRQRESWEAATSEESPGARSFLLIWFAVIFIFFSIPRSKLGEYILPAMPPLAMLAGCGLVSLASYREWRRSRIVGALALINAGVATGIAITFASGIGGKLTHTLAADALAGAAALAIGSAIAYVIAGRYRIAWVGPLAFGVAVAMGFAMKAREDAAPMFSYRGLARAIAPYTGQGCALASYHHIVQALPFYTGTREKLVGYRGELAPFGDTPGASGSFIVTDRQLQSLWGSPQCVVLVANRRDLPRLVGILAPPPAIIGCEGKKLGLYNRPAAGGIEMARECGEKPDEKRY